MRRGFKEEGGQMSAGEIIKMRIERIKQMLDQCPAGIDASDQIQDILQKAPQMLQYAEQALRTGNPALLTQLGEVLDRTEVLVTWATKSLQGQATAYAIREGREADPGLEVDQRLLNRMLKFMLTLVDGPMYLHLIKEFAGDDAVDGDKVYMEPVAESEAFSQWLMHDICLPGRRERAIDLFAKMHGDELPQDEQRLLRLRQADRPSVFKVVDLSGNHEAPGIYLIQDLLSSGDSLRVWDLSSSKTLSQGAVILGRAIPFDANSDLYSLLGTVTQLPDKLWSILSPIIDQWKTDYFDKHPRAAADAFFREHHARLRRKIIEFTDPYVPMPEVTVGPEKKKAAEEIHKVVMKRKKKGKAVETMMRSAHMPKYMGKFKYLMDSCSEAEMDCLMVEYEGLYEFALFLENCAGAIRNGDIEVP
jgi:hypothetical protein